LGLLNCKKPVLDITYNVIGGSLNLTQLSAVGCEGSVYPGLCLQPVVPQNVGHMNFTFTIYKNVMRFASFVSL